MAMLNKYDDSIFYYSKAIEINPEFSKAYYNRGNAEFNLSQFENAIIDFTNAIEISPTYANAYKNRSIVKRKLKDIQGAEEDLKKYNELIQNNDANRSHI